MHKRIMLECRLLGLVASRAWQSHRLQRAGGGGQSRAGERASAQSVRLGMVHSSAACSVSYVESRVVVSLCVCVSESAVEVANGRDASGLACCRCRLRLGHRLLHLTTFLNSKCSDGVGGHSIMPLDQSRLFSRLLIMFAVSQPLLF